jgi:hypothetical protein
MNPISSLYLTITKNNKIQEHKKKRRETGQFLFSARYHLTDNLGRDNDPLIVSQPAKHYPTFTPWGKVKVDEPRKAVELG